jgi:hypothetical protein
LYGPRLGDNGPPENVNGRPEIYTHNIPTNHNVHINHIHIIHEHITMLALGTEARPINKSIKITQHNMNTLSLFSLSYSRDDRFRLREELYLKNKITTAEKRTKLLIIDR